MRKAIRESLEIIVEALNRIDELEHSKRSIEPAQLKPITDLLVRARSYLIAEDRKEVH